MSASQIVVDDLSLRVGAFALRDISFAVAASEIFVILGPSGAGKSLLLETIAGFNRPDSGRVVIDNRDVTYAPPEDRRIGFMFQDYGLFPHLTVAQNVAFGQHFGGGRAHAEPIEGLLIRLGIHHLAASRPGQLSGGEKQRVALARALATDPALFVFDEPLAAIDAPKRHALRVELKDFLRHAKIPTIYVTHDQVDAVALADKMAVMRDGSFAQVGTPTEIFNTPADAATASFVGVETVVEGRVTAVIDGTARIAVSDKVVHAVPIAAPAVGALVWVCIRPEDVALAHCQQEVSCVCNQFAARVIATEAEGPLFKVRLDCGFPLIAYASKQAYLELGLASGSKVVASVKATAVHLINTYK